MTPAVDLRNFPIWGSKTFEHLVFVGQEVHTHARTHTRRHRHTYTHTHDVPQTEVVTYAKFIVEKT